MIYTFYSYKGGVGRSMALANVAELFYSVGLRVLMVDWDLEAPGLERYFPYSKRRVLQSPGIIDLFIDYKSRRHPYDAMRKGDDNLWPFASPNDYKVNVGRNPAAQGSLHLLPAGRRLPSFDEYANLVRGFDWAEFYEAWAGEIYVDWLRQELEAESDVVLIDSRTGVSEIGGISTFHLADVVVMLTAPNEQNLDGTLTMARDFSRREVQAARRYRPLKVLTVPARVEVFSETVSLNKFRDDFTRKLADYVPSQLARKRDRLWNLTIPYVPYYSFYELVAAREDGEARSDPLRKAYENLAIAMADLAIPSESSGTNQIQNAVREHLGRVVADIGWLVTADEPSVKPASLPRTPIGTLTDDQVASASKNALDIGGTTIRQDYFDGPLPSPFPGMRPFSTSESHMFLGRKAEVDALIRSLRFQPLSAVIGPSGSGKSSVVFAGLIPELMRTSLFGAGGWIVRSLRPGRTPVSALTSALGGDSQSIAEAVEACFATEPTARRILVVVDQFEESLSSSDSTAETREFHLMLEELAGTPNCFVVATIRADFYPELLESTLWPLISKNRLEVLPLTRSALREVIVRPALAMGVEVEPALVERLVTDAAGEPGSLSLLQEVLVLLWDQMKPEQDSIRLQDYELLNTQRDQSGHPIDVTDIGTNNLVAAFAMTADAILARLTPNERRVSRRIFLRLVQFGEGRPNARRQQRISELHSAWVSFEVLIRVVRLLATDRLLTVGGSEGLGQLSEGLGELTVDVAHEALIRDWPTLRTWIGELGEDEQTRRRLESKAADWTRLGSGPWALLDERELAEAMAWRESSAARLLGYSEAFDSLVSASRDANVFGRGELEDARTVAKRSEIRADAANMRVSRLQRLGLFWGIAGVLTCWGLVEITTDVNSAGWALVSSLMGVVLVLGFRWIRYDD